jgi:hypothetical protein
MSTKLDLKLLKFPNNFNTPVYICLTLRAVFWPEVIRNRCVDDDGGFTADTEVIARPALFE